MKRYTHLTETTLCYLERDGAYLMLHRVKKKKDVNKGKWIGVGGHVEPGETPEETMRREIREETSLVVGKLDYRGVIEFYSEGWESEVIYLYTSGDFTGEVGPCDEGELRWVQKEAVFDLTLWEGDRIFLKYLLDGEPFFHLILKYRGDELVGARRLPVSESEQ